MTTYKHSNLKQIASAIDVEIGLIAKEKARFEEAALWYQLTRRRPTRIAPSKMRDKLNEVFKNARRLLRSLGVRNTADAADGPGDRELLAALVLLGERNEDPIIEAVERIGRLTEIVEGLTATAKLAIRARKGAMEAVMVGKMTVRAGNPGDDAINDWIAAMMALYRRITGRKPATSVGASERPNEGIAAGPLIRFLSAAGKPLQIKLSEDAWRGRVRTILKGAKGQN